MPNVTPASYPVRHFFRVCKAKWNCSESSQTAAHLTSYKNIDFKSSSLTAGYLNRSTTFHLFKKISQIFRSQGPKPSQGTEQIKCSPLPRYTHTHTNTHPSSFPCKKQNWLPQTNTFFLIFFTLMALHLPFHDCNICYCLRLCNSDISFRGQEK